MQHLPFCFALSLCLAFVLPLPVYAGLTCAARTYIKPDLPVFRQSVEAAIKGTDLLKESRRLRYHKKTVFDVVTTEFLAKEFSPKDIVCIADADATKETLTNSRIWNTYSGTTVLLSPFPIHPNETRHGPQDSNVFTHLATAVARKSISDQECPPSSTSGKKYLPIFRVAWADSQLREECLAKRIKPKREKYKKELLAGLPKAVLGTPSLAIVETYDSREVNSNSNVIALEAFVGAVAALEALNTPLYSLPQASDQQPKSRQFRVIDPVTGQRLPVTTLLKFVGNELVNVGTDLLFRENLQLANEFVKDESPLIEVVSHTKGGAGMIVTEEANAQSFPYSDALEQMIRVFICRDGGRSGIRIFDLDSNSVLSGFEKIGCPNHKMDTKEVVELHDSLLKDAKLLGKLQMISNTDASVLVSQKLSEIAQIQIEQSKTLNEIHKYVGDGALSDQLNDLQQKLDALEKSRSTLFKDLVEIGGAIGRIYTGYGAAGALIGGIEEIKSLYSEMPEGSFKEKRKYFQKNRENFSDAAHISATAVTKIIRAVNDFDELVNVSGSVDENNIQTVKQQIKAVEAQRTQLFREVSDRKDHLEKRWLEVADDLFWARASARSVDRNVAIILEDAVANKFIQSLQTDDFYREFGRCVTSLNAVGATPESFNSTPMQQACGDIGEALKKVKECLSENRSRSKADLVVKGKTKVFRIARDTEAIKCFDKRI